MYLMLAAAVVVGIVMFFWIIMINLAAVLVFAVIFGLLLAPVLVESPASLLATTHPKRYFIILVSVQIHC